MSSFYYLTIKVFYIKKSNLILIITKIKKGE